jgi:hypothetical protein
MINACLDKIYHENEGKIDEQWLYNSNTTY